MISLNTLEIALVALKLLGITLPQKVHQVRVIAELLCIKIRLHGKCIEDLANLPEMTEPHKIAAMRILMNAVPPVFIAKQELFPLVVFTMLKLTLKYGNTPVAAYAYSAYGTILTGIVGEIEAGYRFGQLVQLVLDKFEAKTLKAEAITIFRKYATIPSEGAALPAFIPGVDWSDHWSFWKNYYPAIMITDTAPYRYPYYHTARDTPDKIDYERMTYVVMGVQKMIVVLANKP